MEHFLTYEFTDPARRWLTIFFFWSGFAAWVGIIVSAIFRSSVFNRPWTAFCVGWLGVALGPVIVRTFLEDDNFVPVSPSGIGAAIVFAIFVSLMYYVFSFLFPKHDQEEDELDEAEEIDRLRDDYANMSRADLERELLRRSQEELWEEQPRKKRKGARSKEY